MKPKVTIGVCVRNCEATIRETMESIISQSYPHELIEIIVVDGFSADNTIQIIKEVLSKSSIKTRIFYENKGLGFARQLVADNTEGKYIIWVDGDMILPTNFVEKQVEFMERNSKIGIAKGKYGFLAENSLVAALENMDFILNFSVEKEKMPHVLGTSGCIYRVKALKEVGGFDKNIVGVGEDMEVERRIKAAGWKLEISDAYFYEVRRKNWRALWKEYFWHGKGGAQMFNKKIRLSMKHPMKIFLNKLGQAAKAYKLTYEKKAFLLPIHYMFKRTAWISGFLTEFIKRK